MSDGKTLLDEIREDYKNPKPKKVESRKVDKKRVSWKTRFLIIFVGLVLFVAGVAYCAERYVDWRAGHEWQFPAVWIGFVRKIEAISPIRTGEVSGVVDSTPKTDMEIIEEYYLAPVLKSVYFLESTSGKNDGCKDKGLVNGYGYRQNSFEFKCYGDFSEVTDRVNSWFVERLSTNGNNVIEAVCYYNTGVPHQSSCTYSQNFASVITNNF